MRGLGLKRFVRPTPEKRSLILGGELTVDLNRLPREGEFVRLLPVLLPVVVSGVVAIAVAAGAFAWSNPRASTIVGVLALFGAAAVAEALPVPIEEVHVGATSLATIFIAGTAVLYGWAPTILVGASAMAVVELAHRGVPTRFAYNIALYALSAAAAGFVVSPFARGGAISLLLLAAAAATTAFYIVNISLLAAIVARTSREGYRPLVARYLRMTLLPAAIMASFTVVLVALWDRSPPVAAALIGPLVAISLYQRSAHRERESTRLSRTDPLTSLGNRRAFDDRLMHEIASGRSAGTPVALCLIDVDDLKAVNDVHGHAAGDLALAEVSTQLRRSGEAFRLGGDEFALILPGCDAEEARRVARAVIKRIHSADYANGSVVAASAGVAAYPQHAAAPDALVHTADRALYTSKEQGKNRVKVYDA